MNSCERLNDLKLAEREEYLDTLSQMLSANMTMFDPHAVQAVKSVILLIQESFLKVFSFIT